MSTTITTLAVTPYTGAFLHNTGRKVDVDSTGKRWVAVNDNSTIKLWYSSAPATSWTAATGTLAADPSTAFAFCIDDQDGFHVVRNDGSGYLKYAYGTESAGTITWSYPVSDWTFSAADANIDMVAYSFGGDAYRNVHIVYSYYDSGLSYIYYVIHKILLTPVTSVTTVSEVVGSSVDSNIYPSVDFRHIGDGKTLASSSPDFWVAWNSSEGASLRKYTYLPSSGTWSGNPTRAMGVTASGTLGMCFDGTAVMVAGTDATGFVWLFERNVADTVTTYRGASSDVGTGIYPSLLWDPLRNIYVAGVGAASADPKYAMWTRSTSTWDAAWTTIEFTTASQTNFNLIRHHETNALEVVYTRDLATDDIVWAKAVSLNAAPTAPTWVNTSGIACDVDATLDLNWTFNDPNSGDTQSAYTVGRAIGTTVTYWNGTGWQSVADSSTKISSATNSLSLSSGWGADSDAKHQYFVRTWDQDDLGPSAWSSYLVVIPSAKDNPTLTAPTGTVGPSEIALWTVATQTKFRVVSSDTSSTSDMDAGTLEYDTGVKVGAWSGYPVLFPTNSVTRYVRVQTWNDEGLASDIDENTVTVSYTPPATPTLVATADTPSTGAIGVVITNPGTGATESYNDVYRRVGTDATTAIRVATNVAVDGTFTDWAVASGVIYQYLIRAVADTGATADSAWTS